ncbi:MAG: neutral zinc metallopeptidase [Thermomicrobiales bacterium]
MTLALAFLPLLVSAQESTPSPQGYKESDNSFRYAGQYSDTALAIDTFWSGVFSRTNHAYATPGLMSLDRTMDTGCGIHGPQDDAFYCPADWTIYLSPEFLSEQYSKYGDYAPITVLAHEWGHHVQTLLHARNPGTTQFELQADCLAGAFTQEAESLGLLEHGDLAEAISISEDSGASLALPVDPGSDHGTDQDRRRAVLRGYLDGVAGCGLPLSELTETTTSVPSSPSRAATRSPSTMPTPQTIPTSTITPTPIPSQVVFGGGLPQLPSTLPLDHASCFRIEADEPITFDQLLSRFGGSADAQQRLLAWGWQAFTRRTYACDGPPPGEAGWIEVNVHMFGSPDAAQHAVDYFAAIRAEGSSLTSGAPPPLGDYAVSLAGPASNGNEFTVYASQGPLMIRVTGVAPNGIPFQDVLAVSSAVLAATDGNGPLAPVAPAPEPVPSAAAFLPNAPAVTHSACFSVLARGTYSSGEVVEAVMAVGMSGSQFSRLGWIDGAYVVFTCASPPAGRASQIDIVIHQFRDAGAAFDALPFLAATYRPGQNEERTCQVGGTLVVCVTGRSISGSPLSDVAFVLQQVLSSVG